MVRSRSLETWYAAGQASRQPPKSGAYRVKLVMRAAQGHHGPVISQHRKIIPQQFHMLHMSRETWYAADQASRHPPGSGASSIQLFMRTAQRYHDPVISQHRKIILQQRHIPKIQSFASPVLGKRNNRDEVKLRLNHRGMALRE